MGPVYSSSYLAPDRGDDGDGDTFAHAPSWEFPVPSIKAFLGPNHGHYSRQQVILGGLSFLALRGSLPL